MKIVILLLCLLLVKDAMSGCEDCKIHFCSVGFKNGKIKNSQISASSVYDNRFIPGQGRLDKFPTSGQGAVWVPHSSRRRAGEWLQVDLKKPSKVYGVVTQGRTDHDEWITSYKILYGNSPGSLQVYRSGCTNYDAIFPANYDRNSHVINDFNPPIVARYLRLVVFSYSGQVSLRMDYLTC